MIKETIQGISQALDAGFSDSAIGTDESDDEAQDILDHAIKIKLLSAGMERLALNRFMLNQQFDILFFLSVADGYAYRAETIEKLLTLTEVITADGKLIRRSGAPTATTVDRIIHIPMEYNILLLGASAEEVMTELQAIAGIKE